MLKNDIYCSNIFAKTLFFFTLVLSIPHAAPLYAQEDRITILTEEWPPYNYSEKGVLTGFSIEIVQHIIRDLNSNAVIEIYPSMRGARILRNNPRAMFVSMFKTAERENEFHWIGPLIDSSIYFYKKKDNPLVISTLQEAKNVGSIASRQAGLVHKMLKAAGFTNLDDTAKDGWGVYKKLLAGRCDLGISDSPLGVKYLLKKIGLPTDALTQTPVKLLDAKLYIAVNKHIPYQEVMRWQKSLDNLKQSEPYEQIIKKYSE